MHFSWLKSYVKRKLEKKKTIEEINNFKDKMSFINYVAAEGAIYISPMSPLYNRESPFKENNSSIEEDGKNSGKSSPKSMAKCNIFTR